MGSSALLQRSRAEYFVVAEDFEGGGRNGSDGNGVADGVEDLDGVPLYTVRGNMMIHQFHNVTATETMLRQVARQRYVSIKLIHHLILPRDFLLPFESDR